MRLAIGGAFDLGQVFGVAASAFRADQIKEFRKNLDSTLPQAIDDVKFETLSSTVESEGEIPWAFHPVTGIAVCATLVENGDFEKKWRAAAQVFFNTNPQRGWKLDQIKIFACKLRFYPLGFALFTAEFEIPAASPDVIREIADCFEYALYDHTSRADGTSESPADEIRNICSIFINVFPHLSESVFPPRFKWQADKPPELPGFHWIVICERGELGQSPQPISSTNIAKTLCGSVGVAAYGSDEGDISFCYSSRFSVVGNISLEGSYFYRQFIYLVFQMELISIQLRRNFVWIKEMIEIRMQKNLVDALENSRSNLPRQFGLLGLTTRNSKANQFLKFEHIRTLRFVLEATLSSSHSRMMTLAGSYLGLIGFVEGHNGTDLLRRDLKEMLSSFAALEGEAKHDFELRFNRTFLVFGFVLSLFSVIGVMISIIQLFTETEILDVNGRTVLSIDSDQLSVGVGMATLGIISLGILALSAVTMPRQSK